MERKSRIGLDEDGRSEKRRLHTNAMGSDIGNTEDKGHASSDFDPTDDEKHASSDFDPTDDEKLLQQQVEDVPFEVLQIARSQGHSFVPHQKLQSELRRANKNRPMEMSSKKPVARYREVMQAPKAVHRDPRFESLCGNFDEDRFSKAYSFLFNEELPAEQKKLQKLVKTNKNHEDAGQIQEHLRWIDRQIREEEARRKRALKMTEQKKIEKEAVKEGKRPFYIKKSERRRQELIEKYDQLKASGKLEGYMAKRRKKNAAKDHRYVPYRRTAG